MGKTKPNKKAKMMGDNQQGTRNDSIDLSDKEEDETEWRGDVSCLDRM